MQGSRQLATAQVPVDLGSSIGVRLLHRILPTILKVKWLRRLSCRPVQIRLSGGLTTDGSVGGRGQPLKCVGSTADALVKGLTSTSDFAISRQTEDRDGRGWGQGQAVDPYHVEQRELRVG